VTFSSLVTLLSVACDLGMGLLEVLYYHHLFDPLTLFRLGYIAKLMSKIPNQLGNMI